MKEFSKDTIEIDGKEYTLFLNRLGVVAYERYTEQIQNNIKDLTKQVIEVGQGLEEKELVINDETNPFEDEFVKKAEELTSEAEKNGLELSKRVFWILLYTNHKLTLKEASELYDKACKEYGREQVDELVTLMIAEVNSNKFENENKDLKNLKALHQRKK